MSRVVVTILLLLGSLIVFHERLTRLQILGIAVLLCACAQPGHGPKSVESTPEEARHLVALNVDDEAEDADVFDCVTDSAKAPPDGVICPRYGGTITITKR